MNWSLSALFPVSIVGLSGFVFLRTWKATRALHRLEPIAIFSLWVGVAGSLLWGLSVVLIVLFDQLLLQLSCHFWQDSSCQLNFSLAPLQPSATQGSWAAVLSLPISIAFVVLLRNSKISDWALREILLQDLESTALGKLAKSSSDVRPSLPIALTLKSGHVIIGYPFSPESFANSSPDVDVLPFASGFRDERHELKLTTNYRWIYKLPRAQQEMFIKSITRNQIVSANLFDESRWLQFRKEKKSAS